MKPLRHPLMADSRGRRSPADVLARTIRDHLLRTAADRFCAGMKHRPAAAYLRDRLLIYRNGRWRRTRAELKPPYPAETIDALLWQLLWVRDAIPSDRTVRAALACDPFSIAHQP